MAARSTGYTVTPWTNSVAQTPVTFNTAATTETVTGLTNGGRYSFAVAAINANGASSPSSTSASVVPSTVPGTPSARNAVAGNGGVTLSWTSRRRMVEATSPATPSRPFVAGKALPP